MTRQVATATSLLIFLVVGGLALVLSGEDASLADRLLVAAFGALPLLVAVALGRGREPA